MHTYSILDKIKEPHIRRGPFIKGLLKSHDPESLSGLIVSRIENPSTVGPFIAISSTDEQPTDIVWAMIEVEGEEFRKKIAVAVGLILYKMLHNEINPTVPMLSGVFNIIRMSRLTECKVLVYNWLSNNMSVLVDDNHPLKLAYRDGLMTYGRIQDKSELIEAFFYNLWLEGKPYWQSAAFVGLRLQNPKLAMQELPLLASRKLANTAALLNGTWKDELTRSQFEAAIKRGLKDGTSGNVGWAGQLLNTLLEVMSEEQKTTIMTNLHAA